MALLESSDVVYFAKTDFRSADRLFGIKRHDRRQHTYIIGKTGVGKTALLHNLAVQDIANGEGLCVIDPHGEFVESLLNKVPKERVKDIIYFNPADTDYPLGFNILEIEDLKFKHLVASGLMSIFTKIWSNVWSARMEYIMNNAILALLETPGSTLLGITRILVDKDYRQKIISNVTDPVVKAFWINEFESWRDQFRNEAIAPIQNKVGQFLSTNLIRNVVGQRKSTIDIFSLMNEKKVFLVNVSKGRIGEDNAALIGAMLITKIQLAAMERVRIPEDERKDFFLYVDEFQNFATDSFAGILSEARKYRLNLILAHQYIGQLVTDVSTKVRDAVFGNVGTMITFRVGANDAEFLEKEFTPEFLPEDIVNLPNYSVYLRLMVDGVTSRPFSAKTLPPFKSPTECLSEEEIIKTSRELYSRPVKEVEDAITKWSGTMGDIHGEDSGRHPTDSKFAANCSNCGNSTEVNFKPTEGRPIYCKDCLAKVKSGEIAPVKVGKIKPPRLENQSNEVLAGLGIEFTREKSDRKTVERTPPPRMREMPLDTKPAEAMSLRNLKPIDKKPRERMVEKQQVDIGALRATINQALSEEIKTTNDKSEEKVATEASEEK
ncbi:MAG: type IV secretion system DNA-binding domain-containing protein [bacterium]|nr:type IV secretion system DNA-binding domain-containing protein [bacterium]